MVCYCVPMCYLAGFIHSGLFRNRVRGDQTGYWLESVSTCGARWPSHLTESQCSCSEKSCSVFRKHTVSRLLRKPAYAVRLRRQMNNELNFPPKLRGACSRLYRRRFLQVNTRWKALAEIYTMRSFAPFSWKFVWMKNILLSNMKRIIEKMKSGRSWNVAAMHRSRISIFL